MQNINQKTYVNHIVKTNKYKRTLHLISAVL